MIQRLQSLWLLVAGLLAALTFVFPFYSGNVIIDGKFLNLTASSHLATLILTGALVPGCLVIIFLYKDRKMQLRWTILALAISLLNIIVYFGQMKKFVSGNLSFAAVIFIAVPLFLFLAARGIWKDEKLIKSLDRLR
ncbi:MAG TPA: DUF4293 family protein [Chitinophagaceae bacterium]|jgi:drug/metabolite transporter (DMT)-like permease